MDLPIPPRIVEAATCGNLEAVKKGKYVNDVDEFICKGNTALMSACEHGYADIVDYLLTVNSLNLNARRWVGCSTVSQVPAIRKVVSSICPGDRSNRSSSMLRERSYFVGREANRSRSRRKYYRQSEHRAFVHRLNSDCMVGFDGVL
jgi:ankyrin repeat protein